MVKARSIDVSLQPEKVYEIVNSQLKKNRLIVRDTVDLAPFEKDHVAIIIKN